MTKPKNFILDLLRAYGQKGTSTQKLMSSSRMLKFDENLIRVTISRLVERGFIENFERGLYRLTQLFDPMIEFIQE
jgi:predicted transcriptional regulator of viral defense system